MKRNRTIALVFLASITLVVLAWTRAAAQTQPDRPEFNKLKPEVQILVVTWLHRDCGAAEKLALEKKLIAIGPSLEPVFWEAFRLGPTRKDVEADTGAFASRYADRQSWLTQFGDVQMGKEETARQLAIPQKQYVDREVLQASESYKTQAVAGLGLIGTRQSEAELSRIADDARNGAQIAAQEALKAIRQRSR